MAEITCTCFECKYRDENAKCTAKEIELTSGNIATVWEGRQDVWWCKSFDAKEFYQMVSKILKGGE